MEVKKFNKNGHCVRVNDLLYFERNCEFDVNIPTKSKQGDGGWDFYVPDYGRNDNKIYSMWQIPPLRWLKFPLGIRSHFPQEWVLQINDRSGLSSDYGIFVIGCVVDSGYTGQIHANIYNGSNKNFYLQPNQKICQGLLLKCDTNKYAVPVDVEDNYISNLKTERGDKGFNSTGNGV